jgi:hypothetical protein
VPSCVCAKVAKAKMEKSIERTWIVINFFLMTNVGAKRPAGGGTPEDGPA